MSGDFAFLPAWHDFLPREGGHVIAVFGGGGKTSLLRALAARYGEEGLPVLLTSTTRTEPLAWPGLQVREVDGPSAGAAGDLPAGPVFVRAGLHPDGKWRGLPPDRVDALSEAHRGRILLVEADGSAGLPVKLHRPGEPVWPGRTSLALAVVGLAAVGRPLAEVLHRQAGPRPAWLRGVAADAPWTWDLTFRLLAGEGGYLERVPAGVPTVLVLTQLSGQADSVGLFGFAGRMMAEAGVGLIVFAELAADPPRLRTAYRAGEGGGNGG